MGNPFLGVKRISKPLALIVNLILDYQVRLMINKPAELFMMASRDAVKIHAHPRSLLNAT
jgi:hypothetical protein